LTPETFGDYIQSSASMAEELFANFGLRVREAGAKPALPRNCERRNNVVRPLSPWEGRTKVKESQARRPA
jgi:hypothetical protein